jgi:solute carrier family 8 (sodium/calcium exchanger)
MQFILLPTIFIHWQDYQRKILDRLKELEGVVISGDSRHDSMGHSAKYGAYTIFCCTSQQIIHFSLVQVKIRIIFQQCDDVRC